MSDIQHHIPEPVLAAYAAGSLEQSFALVVATHVSLCDVCRAALGAHQAAGGVILEDTSKAEVSADLKESIFAKLDDDVAPPVSFGRSGIFPAPVMAALKGKPPKWKSIGMGARQCILEHNKTGSSRLIYIPPGRAMPDHSHKGMELTLVLQGSFSDDTGHFGVGDVEFGDEDLEHTPVAGDEMACICLAATDHPLKFSGIIPRILQPVFRI